MLLPAALAHFHVSSLDLISLAAAKPTTSTKELPRGEDSRVLLLLLSRFCRVRLFETPWTAAYQAPPSVGFSRQEYWSGVLSPSPSLRNTGTPERSTPSQRPNAPTRGGCPDPGALHLPVPSAETGRLPALTLLGFIQR